MSDDVFDRSLSDAAPITPDVDAAPDTDAAPDADPAEAAVVSRRRALKVLGAVPLATALGGGLAFGQQAPAQQQPRQTHEAPNQPVQGQGEPGTSLPKRKFFTAREYRTVGILADDIIPRDTRSGSATQAGVPAFMDYHLSLTETTEDTRIAIRGGLGWLDNESRRRFGVPYASAKVAQRHEILDDIAWPAKAKPEMSYGVAFFGRFRDMTASGFFSSAIGWQDLRYQGNVFNPNWNGCPEPALRKLGVSYSMMDSRIAPQ